MKLNKRVHFRRKVITISDSDYRLIEDNPIALEKIGVIVKSKITGDAVNVPITINLKLRDNKTFDLHPMPFSAYSQNGVIIDINCSFGGLVLISLHVEEIKDYEADLVMLYYVNN